MPENTPPRPETDDLIAQASSVDPAEIRRFSALAADWWNPTGDFRPLHQLNPVRLTFIRDCAARHFNRTVQGLAPLDGLTVLDIGCGGGLLSEPVCRLGATVTGIDASEPNIGVARVHAGEQDLAIDYRVATAEKLVSEGRSFDLVLNMEVVEHVADRAGYLAACATLVRPGGAMILATLNRTPKAFALAIVGAEYVLGWLPRGTHRFDRFVRPAELAAALGAAGLEVRQWAGAGYSPFADAWSLTNDLSVNYLAFAVKATGTHRAG